MRPKALPLAVVLAAAATPGLLAQAQIFPTETERVTVDVVVTDKEGRPITGLSREDFVVKENGVAQPILQFEAVDVVAAEPPPARTFARVATNDAPEAPGRYFCVVFDDLNLSGAAAARAREALERFLTSQLREGDRVTLAPTAGGGWWSGRIPDDTEDLLAAVTGLVGRRPPSTALERISDHEAMLIAEGRDEEAVEHVNQRFKAHDLVTGDIPLREGGSTPTGFTTDPGLVRTIAAEVYARARERNKKTLAALERAMGALAGGRGRRAVVLVSEGFIQDDTLSEFRRVRDAARRANAVLYFVDARGLTGAELGLPMEYRSLPDISNVTNYMSLASEYAAAENAGSEALAEDTGGFTIRNANDLAAGLGRISRESRSFYLLGYEPSDKRRDGKFRKLQVEVRRSGARVQARKGYYAPGGDEKPTAAQPNAEVVSALDTLTNVGEIPLRLSSYVLGRAAEGRASVVLVAEADPAALLLEEQSGRASGALESFSTVTARGSGETGRRERLVELSLTPEMRRRMAVTWLPMSHSFELPPGVYQAQFAVRDRASQRVGSVRLGFEVPRLQTLRFTSPILTDILQPGADPAAPARPIPIARRSFAPGSRLTCSFGVEGATDPSRVLVTYEVLRGDGSVATRTEPQPLVPDAQGALSTSFKLTPSRPGRYAIRLHARDTGSGDEATASEEFVVEAPAPAS